MFKTGFSFILVTVFKGEMKNDDTVKWSLDRVSSINLLFARALFLWKTFNYQEWINELCTNRAYIKCL